MRCAILALCFVFLVLDLQDVEYNGHTPLVRLGPLYDCSRCFDQIGQRHVATMRLFSRHTHRDQLKIWYSSYGSSYVDYIAKDARIVGFMAPFLNATPENPNCRVYTVDPASLCFA